jgi:hypothetical protein
MKTSNVEGVPLFIWLRPLAYIEATKASGFRPEACFPEMRELGSSGIGRAFPGAAQGNANIMQIHSDVDMGIRLPKATAAAFRLTENNDWYSMGYE